jgi:hypothetical protein
MRKTTARKTEESAKPSAPAVSEALLHIAQAGNLLSFVPDRAQRLKLMKALTDHGLTAWNKAAAKYELTTFGRRCLADSRRSGSRAALTAS